ncbi:MAG: primosomal protein N' [Chloroflexi bacterium]|nr:primosomal protein N' [Chloroflexota bacterium]
MAYAEVAVNSPGAGRGTFCYAVPPHVPVVVGHGVWVPFGRQRCLGLVFAITEEPSFTPVRDIESRLVGMPEPLLSPGQVELAQWLSATYFCSPFEAAALLLPPGFPQQPRVTYCVSGEAVPNDTSASAEALQLWGWLSEHGPATASAVMRQFGKKRSDSWLASLERRGLVEKHVTWPQPRTAPRGIAYLQLTVTLEQAEAEAEQRQARSPRMAALLRKLATSAPRLLLSQAVQEAGPGAVRTLEKRGLVSRDVVPRTLDPLAHLSPDVSGPPQPTPEQRAAIESIGRARETGKAAVFLLHGVTGSGKTEVYLRAVAQAVALGKRAIVLVPEISLTPQTLSRFMGRFPGQVAVMHSRLTSAEQLDQWQRIRQGQYRVVVGPRGAIFAPQPDLGIIVMDEEHEWTYKQADTYPRYHAREVARKLAGLCGAAVVLGSATPDVESTYRSERGEYALLRLPERITRGGQPTALPQVSLVDMREEWKAGNRSLFSRELCRAVAGALEAREQVILFLNRRGSATTVQCPGCGTVLRCRRCAISLTYHETVDALVCHQCSGRSPVPSACPQCAERGLRFLGAGTQRVEADAQAQFTGARVLRWDLDVTRGRHGHEEVLRRFQEHDADILVGTQMVAKGLDIPLVSVVGVVNADTQLHVPDFRSGERTFQLLAQVAGRAGRGRVPGTVIVQTFTPQHYAVQAAATHDYGALYDREIAFRQTYNYPPLSRLIRLLYSSYGERSSQQTAQRLARSLRESREASGQALEVLGPAPAYPPRVRGQYRWHILLRGQAPQDLLVQVPLPPGWSVDVDPVSLA